MIETGGMMRIIRNFLLLAIMLFLFEGCGGGQYDKVGSLTVDVSSSSAGDGYYNVSAMATYTNPTKTDLVNTPISFETSPAIPGTGLPKSLLTPTNGKVGWNFSVPQLPIAYSFYVVVKTGGLEDSKAVNIPALAALTTNPATLTFTSTEPVPTQKSVAVTGGTSPFTATSNNSALVTAASFGSSVTVTRASNAIGNAVVTIVDSFGASTTVTVTLQ